MEQKDQKERILLVKYNKKSEYKKQEKIAQLSKFGRFEVARLRVKGSLLRVDSHTKYRYITSAHHSFAFFEVFEKVSSSSVIKTK